MNTFLYGIIGFIIIVLTFYLTGKGVNALGITMSPKNEEPIVIGDGFVVWILILFFVVIFFALGSLIEHIIQ